MSCEHLDCHLLCFRWLVFVCVITIHAWTVPMYIVYANWTSSTRPQLPASTETFAVWKVAVVLQDDDAHHLSVTIDTSSNVMGNCHKSRLCEFLHNHCHFLFFGRYQSIFDHHHSSGDSTAAAAAGCSSSAHPPSYNSTYSASNHNYLDSYHNSPRSNHYPGGSDLGSSGSDSRSTARYLKNPSANLAGSGGGGGGGGGGSGGSAASAALKDKMHRQRSASHCPHQIRLNAEGGHQADQKSPGGRKCCCPGSSKGGKLNKASAAASGDPAEQMGRSKRASSLRILNKRFNFHFTDQVSIG